jgi:hypothetical protein
VAPKLGALDAVSSERSIKMNENLRGESRGYVIVALGACLLLAACALSPTPEQVAKTQCQAGNGQACQAMAQMEAAAEYSTRPVGGKRRAMAASHDYCRSTGSLYSARVAAAALPAMTGTLPDASPPVL